MQLLERRMRETGADVPDVAPVAAVADRQDEGAEKESPGKWGYRRKDPGPASQ